MIISLIAALSENRVIGRDQRLPWNLPADLKRFQKITEGHVVIMGRKTFDSIGKPLPKRTNVVITRRTDLNISGAKVVTSLEEALKPYRTTEEEVFILGGGEVFTQALPMANRLYLTIIHKTFEGDTHFPTFDSSQFKLFFEEHHKEPIPFSFLDYERVHS